MTLNVVTKEDLERLLKELIQEIKKLLALQEKMPVLIRSKAVCKMLGISAGKLTKMRKQGKIEFIRIGHIIQYELAHVKELIEKNKNNKGLRCLLYGLLYMANMDELIM